MVLLFQFALLENVLTAIIDEYPHKLRPHRTWICLAGCMVCFFLGLPCATRVSTFSTPSLRAGSTHIRHGFDSTSYIMRVAID